MNLPMYRNRYKRYFLPFHIQHSHLSYISLPNLQVLFHALSLRSRLHHVRCIFCLQQNDLLSIPYQMKNMDQCKLKLIR